MTIGKLILSLLFVSALAIGSTMFFGGFVDSPTYSNTSMTYNQSRFEAVASDTQALAVEMNETISNTEFTGIAAIDLPLTMVRGGYNTLIITMKSINIFDNLFFAIIESTGLDLAWFLVIVMASLGVIFALGIISILLRYDVIGGSRY